MYNLKEVRSVSLMLNIKFDKFTIDDFLIGINFIINSFNPTEQSNDARELLIIVSKIVLKNLNNYPDYYKQAYEYIGPCRKMV